MLLSLVFFILVVDYFFVFCCCFFFFFNDTATTEIYTLSLHDALPIWNRRGSLIVHSALLKSASPGAEFKWLKHPRFCQLNALKRSAVIAIRVPLIAGKSFRNRKSMFLNIGVSNPPGTNARWVELVSLLNRSPTSAFTPLPRVINPPNWMP